MKMTLKTIKKPGNNSFSLIRITQYTCFLLLFILPLLASGQSSRWEQDLSGPGWELYLDKNAEWENDELYLPPVDLDAVPVNPPTGGWDNFSESTKKSVSVPGTVEGYFWSETDSTGEMSGDYLGVSWWSRTFEIPSELEGKRLMLAFQSVNIRAEVFVNQKLVGYDIIGNTPFEVDISDAVNYGGSNNLDIRITDIGGTFSWDDTRAIDWGGKKVPSVHGFGGITGDVSLYATDEVYVDDIYIQNQPDPKTVKVFVTLENETGSRQRGNLSLAIHEYGNPEAVLWNQSVPADILPSDSGVYEFTANVPDAKLWELIGYQGENKENAATLYGATAAFRSNNNRIRDSASQRFGFRWFDIGEKDGDKRLYLNDERVFLLAAMTRGFWPKMGMFPIEGMAERDIQQVIDLGYNMIMYHRAIGQPASMDLADEKGILIYEEPGGYQSLPYPPTELSQKLRKEKLRRMVIRDRSRPSLTNWNLDDWSYNEPIKWDYENIDMVHRLDPSRIVTFNCIQPPRDSITKDDPFQLHMLPFDSTHYYHGWYDPYHFAAQQGYVDEYYNNPNYYARYVLDPDRYTLGEPGNVVPKDQVYFLGEEGAFGTQLNLARIKEDLDSIGADGWMDKRYLNWYESYDRFLDEAQMRDAFPTVEDLTMKMGHNLHYFHGRIIENVRMMNIADAYVLNGWAGASTNTDIVDTYRHSTADPTILPYYAQPLYVAVKLRNKVVPAGTSPVADIFLINEKNLQGHHELNLTLTAPDGSEIFTNTVETQVIGGEEFGQLLTEGIKMPKADQNGYYKLNATLTRSDGLVKAEGSDELFVADYHEPPAIEGEDVALIDTSGTINSFLQTTYGMTLPAFNSQGPRPSVIVLGMYDDSMIDTSHLLDMVKQGTRLIILENANSWITTLPVKKIPELEHRSERRNRNLYGRQFIGRNSLFQGLPQAAAMSWEYQVFYRDRGEGLPISPEGLETIVGVGPTNTGTIGIALCELPLGQGAIILSTLDIVSNLVDDRPDAAVAKKLFVNLLNTP